MDNLTAFKTNIVPEYLSYVEDMIKISKIRLFTTKIRKNIKTKKNYCRDAFRSAIYLYSLRGFVAR